MHQYSLFAYYKHPSGFKFKVDTNTWGEYNVDNANSEKYRGYEFLTNALVGYEKKIWILPLMSTTSLIRDMQWK